MKKKNGKFFIRTFGCAANEADSQRIAAKLIQKGYKEAKDIKSADLVVINSCIVRQSAENRVYGLIKNLKKLEVGGRKLEVVLTGCLAGWALKDKTGKSLRNLRRKIGEDVQVVLTEKLAGFDTLPLRNFGKLDKDTALIPVSWGCSQYCSYCIVPYARGLVRHRKAEEILEEVKEAVRGQRGRSHIILLGENVNVWQDKCKNQNVIPKRRDKMTIQNAKLKSQISNLKSKIKNITTFPQLLVAVAETKGVELVEFMSPNPWDFSDELIEVIAKYPNISKTIHLPLQSGDDKILKKMNRPYTAKNYLNLALKLKAVSCKLSTDLIVGFPGETKKALGNTVKLCRKIGFVKAYIARYSPRPGTASAKLYRDDVPNCEKKRRWQILEKLINKENPRGS